MIHTKPAPLQPLATRSHTVNIGDVAASKAAYNTLSAYGLGSSLGIILFNPERKIGGLAHVMLPSSKADPLKGKEKPGLFVDTAIRVMIHNLADDSDAVQSIHLCAFIVGGARAMTSDIFFDLPENLLKNTRAVLAQAQIPIIGEQTGGQRNRTIHLHLNRAFLEIQAGPEKKEVSLL